MVKIALNKSYGGFGLSWAAAQWLASKGLVEAVRYLKEYTEEEHYSFDPEIPRHHPLLIECIETLGEASSEEGDELVIETIEGNRYRIEEYDGLEWVVTPEQQVWIVVE